MDNTWSKNAMSLLKAINAVSDEKQKSDLLKCFLDISDSIADLKTKIGFKDATISSLERKIEELIEESQIEHLNKKK